MGKGKDEEEKRVSQRIGIGRYREDVIERREE